MRIQFHIPMELITSIKICVASAGIGFYFHGIDADLRDLFWDISFLFGAGILAIFLFNLVWVLASVGMVSIQARGGSASDREGLFSSIFRRPARRTVEYTDPFR